MGRRPRTAAGHVVEFVAVTERRRVTLAVGVPFLFWLLFELTANLGFLPLALAAGLAAYLYTRETARETLAASAAGTGLLMVGLFLLELYWNGARGSTESLEAVATRSLWWALVGTVLVALGIRFRATNRRDDRS